MTALAWASAAVSLVVFLLAAQASNSCAATYGPYCAGALFASWLWLAYRYDRRTP